MCSLCERADICAFHCSPLSLNLWIWSAAEANSDHGGPGLQRIAHVGILCPGLPQQKAHVGRSGGKCIYSQEIYLECCCSGRAIVLSVPHSSPVTGPVCTTSVLHSAKLSLWPHRRHILRSMFGTIFLAHTAGQKPMYVWVKSEPGRCGQTRRLQHTIEWEPQRKGWRCVRAWCVQLQLLRGAGAEPACPAAPACACTAVHSLQPSQLQRTVQPVP
jgi:hypothetical protein